MNLFRREIKKVKKILTIQRVLSIFLFLLFFYIHSWQSSLYEHQEKE